MRIWYRIVFPSIFEKGGESRIKGAVQRMYFSLPFTVPLGIVMFNLGVVCDRIVGVPGAVQFVLSPHVFPRYCIILYRNLRLCLHFNNRAAKRISHRGLDLEGRKEGWMEGMKEGRRVGGREGREEGRKEGRLEGRKAGRIQPSRVR